MRAKNISVALIASLLCCANCVAGESKSSGLSSEWRHRRPITLSTPTTQAGCVMPVVLNTHVMGDPYAHVNKDGSDIRFTGPDGKRLLNYWIESWDCSGVSKLWVKLPDAETKRIYVCYGNRNAKCASDGSAVFDFFDDFNDGIWTKYGGNPVITRTQPWEARVICEPCIIHEDGIFKMWFMGCSTGAGYNAALGYATSKDGLAWTKHPDNPILRDPKDAIIRTTVLKHKGTYYLFASDHQWSDAPGVINRWTSKDGLRWTGKTTVLRPTEPWEKHFHNVGVVVDDDGTWQMLINTSGGPLGYAYSQDGLHWTKRKTPVITGFYGGDPYLTKIGDKYYTWHSQADSGGLRIYCRWSTDMIHWKQVYNNPQIGYTQPWERGIGRPEVNWDAHLSDAELLEHDGKVFMYYQGAQCPFGRAVFHGTLDQLAARLEHPPLLKWAESPYGCVENNELKISDNQTGAEPICERTSQFSNREKYTLECRIRCYAAYRQEPARKVKNGWSTNTRAVAASTRSAAVVMRYVDKNNFARFRTEDDKTYYEECIGGTWSKPVNVGANNACDSDWHRWRIVADGPNNSLYIDGKQIGAHKSSPALTGRKDLRIGFSTQGTFAGFDDVRVRRHCSAEPEARIGPDERM